MSWYQDMLFRGTKIDLSPEMSRRMILDDGYLRHVYMSHANTLCKTVGFDINSTAIPGVIIEIGAAGGITKEYLPSIITLDVRADDEVSSVINNEVLPFDDESVDGVIGKDVFHHIPNVIKHLEEVQRVLFTGGKCAYIEPNWNLFSRIFYTVAHPEPWIKSQQDWSFESRNPMFSNQALPWIVFKRDELIFEKRFPNLKVEVSSVPLVGLSYIISGGLNRRNRLSSKLLVKIYEFEQKFETYLKVFGLSRLIVITKLSNQSERIPYLT
jgi:SAM-dependent methyltransferase